MANGAHDGHRERMRQKYLHNGPDSLELHEIVEMLLYYGVPRKNTNELAHKLLQDFGSLSAIFDAPFDLLCNSGVSESCAVLLKLVPDICRMYYDDKYRSEHKIITNKNAGDVILNKFIGRTEEVAVLMLLDSKCREQFCGVINRGSFSGVEINLQRIVSIALRYRATYALIAHNHPSGIALPSDSDMAVTRALYLALRSIGVALDDHFIVADDDYVSLKQSGLWSSVQM